MLRHVFDQALLKQVKTHVFFWFIALFSNNALAVSSINFTVGAVDAPIGQLKNTQFQVDLKGAQPTLKFKSEIKPNKSSAFIPFNVECANFSTEHIGQIHCENGLITAKQIQAPFSVDVLSYPGDFSVSVAFNKAQFSDETGLHAGQNLVGSILLAAQKKQNSWFWSGLIRWSEGELYWQPYYFAKAGNVFAVSGTFDSPMLNISNASLLVNEVGQMQASAKINTNSKAFESLKVNAQNVDFAGLYNLFLQPQLLQSAFGNLDVSGMADWQFELKNLQPINFELNLKDGRLHDKNGKFAFNHVNAHIPWDYDTPQNISLSYSDGYLLNLPLGATKLQAEVNRYALTSPNLTLPVLNGALQFEDVSAAWLGANWVWHLRMDLKTISMNQFSVALGWPEMQGKVSGAIPLVTYANKQLNMDGAMVFNMFDGTVGMNNLRIDDPLGVVPRMYADLTMRKIDLGDLTRTFKFGTIEGKLDGDVKGLVMENWKPVRMDASLKTSADKQVKKISQRAVENITALGGEGTAVALQRTFLRFFKEFNYDKIGLTCKLRTDICEMGGVESTSTGYIIVKGDGIPAVNVNGFTDFVSLSDLLERIKRITDSNTKAIVK